MRPLTFILALAGLAACAGAPREAPIVPPTNPASAGDPAGDGLALPPLHRAAMDGDSAEVARLVGAGAEVDALAQIAPLPEATATPLHLASAAGHAAVVDLLIGAGADVDAASPLYGTPLTLAAGENGDPGILARLLQAGADPDAPNAEGDRPLHRALKNGHLRGASLLAPSVSPEATDGDGQTPLVLASRAGAPLVVKALLKNGADPTRADASAQTPLEAASDEATATLLREWGADPAYVVPLPDRAARICVVVMDGNAFRLRSWASQGVDFDVLCARPFSPLGMAAFNCRPEMVQTLLDLGADANVCVPPYGQTTCGSSGGLGSVTHGTYPLAQAEARLRTARDEGDTDKTARCEATAALLRPATGRVPDDLRPATED